MLRKIITYIFGFLLFLGLYYELGLLIDFRFSIYKFIILIFCMSIIFLVYVLPISFFTFKFSKKEEISKYILILSFIGGGLIIGSLAGMLNFQFSRILLKIFGGNYDINKHISSIAPPIVEEFLKIIVVVFITIMFKLKTVKSWFFVGISVGLGFQFFEDYSYIAATMMRDTSNVISEVLSRLKISYVSHWMLTSFFAAGVSMFIYKRDLRKSFIPYLYSVLPFLLHAIWNSVWIDSEKNIQILNSLFTVISIGLFINLYNYIKKIKIKEYKEIK